MRANALRRNFFLLLFPFLSLILPKPCSSQGVLWGVTEKGGNGVGVVYRVNIDGTNQIVQKNLFFDHKGYSPKSRITIGANGKLYGTASKGGEGTSGVVYEYDPVTNAYLKKFDFDALGGSGWSPYGGVIQAPNGKFYGTVMLGPTSGDYGAIFELDLSTGNYSKKYTFTGSGGPQGAYPKTTLLLGSNGKLYGTTSAGGVDFRGVLFEYDVSTSTYAKKIDFGSNGWKSEDCDLIQAPNGMIYGTAWALNTGNSFLYEYNPLTGSITRKADGFLSSNQLTFYNNKIYGVGLNQILEYDIVTGVTTAKYTMTNPASDGMGPRGLIVASNGKLYGVCERGGLSIGGNGTETNGIIFEFDLLTSAYTKKYSFVDNGTGTNPLGGLVDIGGKIFGVTQDLYSAVGAGKMFSYNYTANTIAVTVSFGDNSSGKFFTGSLAKTSNGLFLGLSKFGGETYNAGSMVAIDPTYPPHDYRGFGQITSFGPRMVQTPSTGAFPEGGMTLALNGRFYSVTASGGAYGYGTIFETIPGTSGIGSGTATANFSVVHHFTSPHSVEGAQCGLTAASNGKLYAMTSIGGANNLGSIYEYNIGASTVTTLFSFDGANGSTPFGNLLQAPNGKMYGMTKTGGTNSHGVIFEFNPVTGSVVKLFDFTNATTGSAPRGNLIQAANSKLYGMTSEGGGNGAGVLFEFDLTNNSYTKRADFNPSVTGSNPYGSLYQSPNGNLYGTTYRGGANDLGTFFEFNPVTNALTKKFDFNGTNGANPVGSLIYDSYTPAAPQTITFQSVPNKTYGDPSFALIASSSSGLPVTFAVSQSTPNNVVSISGNVVTILNPGSVTISASQAGNASYYPAATVKQSFVVNPLTPTVTFTSASTGIVGTTVALTVNKGGSSGAVTYSVTSGTGNASVIGGSLSLASVGTVTITADVAAQGVFGPGRATQQFTISAKQPQTINFTGITPTSKCVGATFTLSATSTSGLPVTFVSSNSSIASIVGTTVTIKTAGTFIITASQSGNAVYDPAPSVSQTITGVAKPLASITASGPTTFCPGSTLSLTANPGDAGNTYAWSTGATTRSISVTAAGTFSVTVTNTNGCSSNAASTTTTVLSTPATYISSTYDLCVNGYVRLTATNVTGAVAYNWSTGASTPYINVYSAGVRTVTVTFSNGCTRTASYTVSPCTPPDPCDPPPVESTAARTTPCDEQITLKAEKDRFMKETVIYPNKANDRIWITIPTVAKSNLQVVVYAQSGQKVGSYLLFANTDQLLIDTRSLKNGMYMVNIAVPNSKGEVLNRKIMIEH